MLLFPVPLDDCKGHYVAGSYFKVLDATEEVFFTLVVNAYPSIATFFFLG